MNLKVIDIIQPCRMGSKYFTDSRSEFPAADHVDEWAVNGVNQGRLSDVRCLYIKYSKMEPTRNFFVISIKILNIP